MRAGRAMLLPWLALAGVWGAPGDSVAQAGPGDVAMTTGVEPDTVTVGDRFRVGIRVSAPAGVTVRFPTFDDPTSSLQLSEPARTVRDPDDPRVLVHVYPLIAWRTEIAAPVVPVELVLPDGTIRRIGMELPLPHVRSVLPAGATEVAPRGHRGIVVAAIGLALWPVLLLLALLALIATWFLARRLRRPAGNRVARIEHPREWALAELDRARTLWHPADQRPYFSGVSGALRGYAAALSPAWSTDLTTGELMTAMRRDGVDPDRGAALRELLETADRVKFAKTRLAEDEARSLWRAARAWVQRGDDDSGTGQANSAREAA